MLDSLLPHAMEHSFRDFHAKGLDYLCLRRSEDLTLKVYFFDGDSSLTPEVVNPHDHRYDFTSRVLDGVVENVTYRHSVLPGVGLKYHAFSYLTPLNGGSGFKERGSAELVEDSRRPYYKGDQWRSYSETVHTLSIRERGTVLLLRQFRDCVPVGMPTTTYVQEGRSAPTLDGLYSRFTTDQLIARVTELEARTGMSVSDLLRGIG